MVYFSPKGDSRNMYNSQFNSNSKRYSKREDDKSFNNTLFELAAEAVKNTKERTIGFKDVFNNMSIHAKFLKPVFGIGCKVMSHWKTIEELLKSSGILTEHPDIDKNLLRVVVTELLWGHKKIAGTGDVFDIVREKKQELTGLLKEHEEGDKDDKLQVFFARVNSLKVSVRVVLTHLDEMGYKLIETPSKYKTYLQEIAKLDSNSFMVDFHFKDLFAFSALAKSTLIPNAIVQDKLLIIQNKSSLVPVHLMDVKPGNTVLDMCAAPGMKTAIIASQLKGEGKVWAVDKHRSRYVSMVKNLNAFGAQKMSYTVNCDVLTLQDNTEDFNVILLDAPCSGSGIAERLGETDNNPMRLRKLQWIQMKLLTQALTKYPNAKRVVYSTCSIYPDENEVVIDEVMKKLKDELTYKLVDCHELISGFSKGSEDYNCGSSCIKISVEDDCTNGFFVAVFDKDLTLQSDGKSSKKTKAGNKRKHSEVKEKFFVKEENDEEEEDDAENAEDDSDEEEVPQPQTLVRKKKGKKTKQIESSPKKMKLQNEKSTKTIVQKKNKKKHSEFKEELAHDDEKEEDAEGGESAEEDIPQPQTIEKKKKGKKSKQTKTAPEIIKLQNEKPTEIIVKKKNKRKHSELKEEVADENEEDDAEIAEGNYTERTEGEGESADEGTPQPKTIVKKKKGKKSKNKNIESPSKKMKLQNEKSVKTNDQNKTTGKKAKKVKASPEKSVVDRSLEITNNSPVKSKKNKQKNQKETTQSEVTSIKSNKKQKHAAGKINVATPHTNMAMPKKSKRKNKKSN